MRDYAGARVVPEHAVRTEVVIVGNGPSALSLSQILSGWEPYLAPSAVSDSADDAHPDDLLSARLRALAQPSRTLLEHDLRSLAQGLEGRARTPLALLLDALERPGADAGREQASLLRWRMRPSRRVDHVVLGRGPPGGAWQAMDGSILTLSLASWMELPGLSFRAWESCCGCEGGNDGGGGGGGGGGRGGGSGRVSAAAVARYYSDYVHARGIARFQRSGCVVTSVRPLGDGEGLWLVEGYEEDPTVGSNESGRRRSMRGRKRFCYAARHVVLATGAFDRPNALGIPGEALAHRNLRELEGALDRLAARAQTEGTTPDPVLVVGAGLSAADAVIAARHRGLPVLHAFRRQVTQLELTQLPSSMYPEYHKVHQMMRDGGANYPRYTALPETHLLALKPGHARLLGPNVSSCDAAIDSDSLEESIDSVSSAKSGVWCKTSIAAVLVGARPDLRYLRLPVGDLNELAIDPSRPIDPKTNPIHVDPVSYCVLNAPAGLYALGPLVGDTFVRFVLGGAVGVASHIHKIR